MTDQLNDGTNRSDSKPHVVVLGASCNPPHREHIVALFSAVHALRACGKVVHSVCVARETRAFKQLD